MNIAFFLLPKKEVMVLTPEHTVRQALERMEYHRYSAVPLIDDSGRYVGTITEGDILWALKNTKNLSLETVEKLKLKEINRKVINKTVHIDAQIEDLLTLAIIQNFVPVVDDNQHFIGIIRRREIIEYCASMLRGPDAVQNDHSLKP